MYRSLGYFFTEGLILIGWLVGGAILAFIRFFIFVLDLAHPAPKAGAARHRTKVGFNATPGWDESAWKTARPLLARADGEPSEAK